MPNRAGFRDREEGLYLFTTEAFREACGNVDPKLVAGYLEREGYLHAPEEGRHTYRFSVGPKRARFYAVKESFWGWEPGR